MELYFNIAGVILIILSISHLVFPRYFNWRKEFSSLSLVNRQMFYVHTFFIAFTVFLMGLLCLTSFEDFSGNRLGKKVALALGVFWGIRFFFQLFIYSPKLWKGRFFETAVHIFLYFFGHTLVQYFLLYTLFKAFSMQLDTDL